MPGVRHLVSSMSEVVLYKCVVCGQAYTKVQSLRAHLKRHRDLEWVNLTIRVPKAMAERFKAACKSHNTTTCLVISSIIEAVLKGQDMGVVDLARLVGPNPLVVTMHEYFMGRPRGHYRVPVSGELFPSPRGRCPECGSSDVYEQKDPFGSEFRTGRCKKCGADWCVNPRKSYLP